MRLEADGLPQGWFTGEDITAYRKLVGGIRNGRIAEVGVYMGRSLCAMLPTAKAGGNHVTAIDAWTEFPQALVELRAHLAYFGHASDVEIVQSESTAAAKQFPDGHFDLVFLDGCHLYEAIRADLAAWLPKVKDGGWIGGHDYSSAYPGVIQAVGETFPHAQPAIGGYCWAVRVARGDQTDSDRIAQCRLWVKEPDAPWWAHLIVKLADQEKP